VDDDEDEVLEPGRPALPRPARIAALVLIVAALAALFAIRLWPDSGPKAHRAALDTPPPPPLGTHFPEPTDVPLHDWPTAQNGCDGTTDVAIAHTRRPAGPTGLTLLLGGSTLRVVDFDTGRITALPDSALGRGAYIASLTGTPTSYATTVGCGANAPPHILRIGADRSVQDLGRLATNHFLLADGDRAWLATGPGGLHHRHGTITPIGGGPSVRLPAHVYPDAVVRGKLVGTLQPNSSSAPTGLALLDVVTGRILRRFTSGTYPIATGGGQVVWTSGCDPDQDRACTLHRTPRPAFQPWLYTLPRPAFAGAVSSDGNEVALVLERPPAGQRYTGHPFPPSEIAVLNLLTGGLYRVPGLLIPAKASPGLAFSADGRWLAIALDAGTKTRLLAWHPGLGRAYEMAPLSGGNYGSPPLVLMPDATR
jgi:hypothetical protein